MLMKKLSFCGSAYHETGSWDRSAALTRLKMLPFDGADDVTGNAGAVQAWMQAMMQANPLRYNREDAEIQVKEWQK